MDRLGYCLASPALATSNRENIFTNFVSSVRISCCVSSVVRHSVRSPSRRSLNISMMPGKQSISCCNLSILSSMFPVNLVPVIFPLLNPLIWLNVCWCVGSMWFCATLAQALDAVWVRNCCLRYQVTSKRLVFSGIEYWHLPNDHVKQCHSVSDAYLCIGMFCQLSSKWPRKFKLTNSFCSTPL